MSMKDLEEFKEFKKLQDFDERKSGGLSSVTFHVSLFTFSSRYVSRQW
jgi:hypothetical protein